MQNNKPSGSSEGVKVATPHPMSPEHHELLKEHFTEHSSREPHHYEELKETKKSYSKRVSTGDTAVHDEY